MKLRLRCLSLHGLSFALVSCLLVQAICSVHVQAAAAPDRIRVGLSSYTPINAAIDGAACKRGRDMAFVENMIPRLVNLLNQARAHDFPICFVRTSGNQWTNSPVWTEFKNPELLACADGTWGPSSTKAWNRGPAT